jgi:hypothetical protein
VLGLLLFKGATKSLMPKMEMNRRGGHKFTPPTDLKTVTKIYI